jgi:flagellar hook-basal body complex protein FliE
MKRIFLSLAMVALFATSFVSCRETKETKIEVNTDDVSDDLDDAIDDVGDAIEDAADDVEDVLTGEDDN